MGWQIKFLLVNGAFSVRKCIVKPKEKIMVASYGKTSGFSAVGAEELMLVNGGKGGGGGGGGGSSVTSAGFTTPKAPTNQVTVSVIPVDNPSVSVKMGNTTVKAEASITYSLTTTPVTVNSATVSVNLKR
jgi:hypothetical protein